MGTLLSLAYIDSESQEEKTWRADEWSDTVSLSELEGEDLEVNLQALRTGLPDTSLGELEVTTPYEEIRGGKLTKAFSNAEKNHGLGYNSLLKYTIVHICATYILHKIAFGHEKFLTQF